MLKKLNNVTIGTDAELFLKYQDDLFSAIGFIGGSKKNPKPIGNNCFIQEDNILAEFNIPPVKTKEDFVNYINYCKDWIYVNYPELTMHFSSSEEVDFFLLTIPGAKEFGCEPDCIVDLKEDSDSLTKDEHEIFNMSRMEKNLRTSGFHIHIGYDNPNEETNREIVKLFEKYVTMPLIPSDNDKYNRRSMYGRAGSYRHKSYGVECRSLGGYFIKDSDFIGEVYDLTMEVIERYNKGERVSKEEFKQIKQIINKQTEKVCVD